MAIFIRQSKDIKGIWVGNTEFKVSQLADDTGMFVLDIESIKNVIKCLKDFKEISGLKMNVDKTVAKPIGSLRNVKLDNLENVGLVWSHEPITTLGITITNDPVVNIEKNFKSRLKVMRDILNIWLARNLSLKGKITVLKSLVLPKLLYVSSNMPVPMEVIKEADRLINNFLWDHKKSKIKKNVMIQSIDHGGLRAPDFFSMVKASRVAWVKRLLSQSKSKWKSILQEYIHPLTITDYIQTTLDCDKINNMSPFYKDIFTSWVEIKQQPIDASDFLNEILWYNKFIQTPIENIKQKKMKSILFRDLYKKGIVKLGDLINSTGEFMSLDMLNSKVGLKLNILRYQKLKMAIPKQWLIDIKTEVLKSNLYSDNNGNLVYDNKYYNYMIGDKKQIQKASTKFIYNCFVYKKHEIPTAVMRWNDIYEINEEDWVSIFRVPYACSKDTYLQSFQFRIIHRIFPCNKWLHTLKIIDSDLCEHCEIPDSIEHYLFSCNKVGNFWGELEKWYNHVSDTKVVLTLKHVIFGLYYDIKDFSVINYIIMLGKQYIRRQKYKDSPICVINFLVHLRTKLDIEMEICQRNNTLNYFNKKWSKILEYL